MKDETFMRITNKDIYEKIENMLEKNTEEHRAICKRVEQTNGKVKLNRWIATTALTLTIAILGFALEHSF